MKGGDPDMFLEFLLPGLNKQFNQTFDMSKMAAAYMETITITVPGRVSETARDSDFIDWLLQEKA